MQYDWFECTITLHLISRYAIAGKEEEWQDALGSSTLPTMVSIR